MHKFLRHRLALSTVITTLMILVFVAAIGTAGLVFLQGKSQMFRQEVSSTFADKTSKNQETLMVENQIFHPSTQQFNFTFVNAGNIAINITKIQINSPTLSVTAIPSASITSTAQTSVISSKSKSITYAIPGSVIFSGSTYTSAIPYNCLTDPVSVSVTTSRGLTINTQVVPNVSWYDSHWQFRKKITVDYTKVSSTLSNFAALINITDTDLKNKALTDGNDILFTACDGKTKLNHELENYTSSTGSLTAWVKISTLYTTPNDIIYMYYGNSGSGNQQNAAATWDPNYAGVWHFTTTTGSASIILDNAVTANNLPTQNTQVQVSGFKVGSGSNRLLLVATSIDNSYFDWVKYGGTNLTPLQNPPNNPKLNGVDVEFWYLIAPPSGTADIIAKYHSDQDQWAAIGVYSLFGVDQTTPIAKFNSNFGTGITPSVTITNSYANSWVLDNTGIQNGGGLSNPTQTKQWNNLTGSSDSTASSKAVPALTNTPITFSWTGTGSTPTWAAVAVEIKGVVGSAIVPDSTSNKNDLTTFNIAQSDSIPGQFYNGMNFDGTTKYLARTSSLNAMPAINGPQTGSMWFWYPSAPSGKQNIYSLQDTTFLKAVEMGFGTTTTYDMWKGDNSVFLSTSIPTSSNWHYGVYTYDGTTHRFYLDGVQKATSATSPQVAASSALYVGTFSSLTQYYKGKLDEFRYSTTARSASWISTEYNNQASPSTFYTIGPPEKVTDVRSSQ